MVVITLFLYSQALNDVQDFSWRRRRTHENDGNWWAGNWRRSTDQRRESDFHSGESEWQVINFFLRVNLNGRLYFYVWLWRWKLHSLLKWYCELLLVWLLTYLPLSPQLSIFISLIGSIESDRLWIILHCNGWCDDINIYTLTLSLPP